MVSGSVLKLNIWLIMRQRVQLPLGIMLEGVRYREVPHNVYQKMSILLTLQQWVMYVKGLERFSARSIQNNGSRPSGQGEGLWILQKSDLALENSSQASSLLSEITNISVRSFTLLISLSHCPKAFEERENKSKEACHDIKKKKKVSIQLTLISLRKG